MLRREIGRGRFIVVAFDVVDYFSISLLSPICLLLFGVIHDGSVTLADVRAISTLVVAIAHQVPYQDAALALVENVPAHLKKGRKARVTVEAHVDRGAGVDAVHYRDVSKLLPEPPQGRLKGVDLSLERKDL
jgi:hypothetical protein